MSEFKELPEGWEAATIGKIASYVQRGKSPKYINLSELPVINQKCIQWHGLDIEHIKYIHPEQLKTFGEERFLKNGDILWNSTGTGTLGRACIYKSLYFSKAVVDSHVTIIRFNIDNINPNFVFYFIASPFVQMKIEVMQSGSTNQVELGKAAIIETPIPLPPLLEQHRIVTKIEELFSSLDKGIENLKTAQAQLKTYRQAVLKYAFEGKLTNENVKDGELPEEWKWTTLKDVCEIKRGKSKHRPRDAKELFGGKYPFIQTGDVRNANGGIIRNYSQTYNEIGLAQSKLWPKNTLCLTIAANIGETAFLGFDACFPDSVVGVIANGKMSDIKYLNFYIQRIKQELDSKASATAQKNINVEFLNKVIIPICPLPEQHRIVSEIETRLSVCDKLEESITQSLLQAEGLRQSILKKAFEGKLVPQDPNDEPASALLERIRAERESVAAKNAAGGRGKKKKGQIG